MSGETTDAADATATTAADQEESGGGFTTPSKPHISWSDSYTRAHTAIQSLSSIIPHIPSSLSSSETPAFSLLHDAETAAQISQLLRNPDSGAGDNHLCRWLYDTFQSSEPDLHLVVLRFLPTVAGVYLSRVSLHRPLAGFEAVLLALYAHETTTRNGQAVTVNIPDLSHSSIYHETKQVAKNSATELNLAVISPSLEPHGTVRSMKRARIVGVALELYYRKIPQIPIESKLDFCEFCKIWSGQFGDQNGEKGSENSGVKGRINLPWELLQPVLMILGHCMMGYKKDDKLHEAACVACRSLYNRALHDLNPKAILATGSLIKLVKMASESEEVDYTEIKETNIITL